MRLEELEVVRGGVAGGLRLDGPLEAGGHRARHADEPRPRQLGVWHLLSCSRAASFSGGSGAGGISVRHLRTGGGQAEATTGQAYRSYQRDTCIGDPGRARSTPTRGRRPSSLPVWEAQQDAWGCSGPEVGVRRRAPGGRAHRGRRHRAGRGGHAGSGRPPPAHGSGSPVPERPDRDLHDRSRRLGSASAGTDRDRLQPRLGTRRPSVRLRRGRGIEPDHRRHRRRFLPTDRAQRPGRRV